MKISQCFVCVRERTNARVPRARGLVVTLENVFSRYAAKSVFLLVSRAIRMIDGSLVDSMRGNWQRNITLPFSLFSLCAVKNNNINNNNINDNDFLNLDDTLVTTTLLCDDDAQNDAFSPDRVATNPPWFFLHS